jgi:hypothetical protein
MERNGEVTPAAVNSACRLIYMSQNLKWATATPLPIAGIIKLIIHDFTSHKAIREQQLSGSRDFF